MKQRRVCVQGHVFFKSSDCPTCPRCEGAKKPVEGFLSGMAAPARRALLGAGLTTLARVARRTEKEVSALHGMGPRAMDELRASLKKAGLTFARGQP